MKVKGAFFCTLAAGLLMGGAVRPARSEAPTFSKDVVPILQKHCQECHRPGEAVPMNLIEYSDVRPWVKSVKKAVAERAMPPWHADPSIGKWKNDRRMSEDEIKTVVAWADSGALQGDPKDLPPPAKFTEGWKIGKPDAIFTFAEDEILPAELEDEYHYVSMHTNFKEDRWVKAVECRPGNIEVVHHIIAFAKPSGMSMGEGRKRSGAAGEGFTKPQQEAQPERRQKKRSITGEVSALGGMAPGTPPHVMPKGEAILIPAGSDIVFQVHYHKAPGKVEKDRSSVGLQFADYTVEKQHRSDAVANVMFAIPPNNDNHEVNASMMLEEDIDLQTVMPHMHLRGKDMKVWAKFPDGTEKDLIWVPRYDFNWQTIYEFSEPLRLPKGTRLFAKAHYNNSTSNPSNPNPNDTVRFGEPTTAEMMFAFLSYTLPEENLGAHDPGDKGSAGVGQ